MKKCRVPIFIGLYPLLHRALPKPRVSGMYPNLHFVVVANVNSLFKKIKYFAAFGPSSTRYGGQTATKIFFVNIHIRSSTFWFWRSHFVVGFLVHNVLKLQRFFFLTDGSPKKEGLNRKMVCGRRQPTQHSISSIFMSLDYYCKKYK